MRTNRGCWTEADVGSQASLCLDDLDNFAQQAEGCRRGRCVDVEDHTFLDIELLSRERAIFGGDGPCSLNFSSRPNHGSVIGVRHRVSTRLRVYTDTSKFSRITLMGQPCNIPLVARNALPTPPPTLKRRRSPLYIRRSGAINLGCAPQASPKASMTPRGSLSKHLAWAVFHLRFRAYITYAPMDLSDLTADDLDTTLAHQSVKLVAGMDGWRVAELKRLPPFLLTKLANLLKSRSCGVGSAPSTSRHSEATKGPYLGHPPVPLNRAFQRDTSVNHVGFCTVGAKEY